MTDYFEARGVRKEMYENQPLPMYYKEILDLLSPESRILDFGCGFGQTLNAIKNGNTPWGGGDEEF